MDWISAKEEVDLEERGAYCLTSGISVCSPLYQSVLDLDSGVLLIEYVTWTYLGVSACSEIDEMNLTAQRENSNTVWNISLPVHRLWLEVQERLIMSNRHKWADSCLMLHERGQGTHFILHIRRSVHFQHYSACENSCTMFAVANKNTPDDVITVGSSWAWDSRAESLLCEPVSLSLKHVGQGGGNALLCNGKWSGFCGVAEAARLLMDSSDCGNKWELLYITAKRLMILVNVQMYCHSGKES